MRKACVGSTRLTGPPQFLPLGGRGGLRLADARAVPVAVRGIARVRGVVDTPGALPLAAPEGESTTALDMALGDVTRRGVTHTLSTRGRAGVFHHLDTGPGIRLPGPGSGEGAAREEREARGQHTQTREGCHVGAEQQRTCRQETLVFSRTSRTARPRGTQESRGPGRRPLAAVSQMRVKDQLTASPLA